MAKALLVLMYAANGASSVAMSLLYTAIPIDDPSNANTNDIVVEVGNPSVLYTSSKMTLDIITAKNSSITS